MDRDGVINELVCHQEREVIDSPFTPGQFKLIPGVKVLTALHDNGYLTILVSNQPGIAKGHFTAKNFELIRRKMNSALMTDGAELNGEYYCLNQPEAVIEKYRVQCECRKPFPGLLFKATRENNIDLKQSWLIGDNLSDIQAGETAGCRTILIGTMKYEMRRLMTEKNVFPDKIVENIGDTVRNHILLKEYVVILPENL